MIKRIYLKYQMFIKYIIVALVSFLIDITLFTIFNSGLLLSIVVATIAARIISSFINFLLNKNKVFKSSKNKYKSFLGYYLLTIIQMFASAFLVNIIHKIIIVNPTIIKIPVECILFLVNYVVQKFIIFNGEKNEKE